MKSYENHENHEIHENEYASRSNILDPEGER